MGFKQYEKVSAYLRQEIDREKPKNKLYQALWGLSMLIIAMHYLPWQLILLTINPMKAIQITAKYSDNEGFRDFFSHPE